MHKICFQEGKTHNNTTLKKKKEILDNKYPETFIRDQTNPGLQLSLFLRHKGKYSPTLSSQSEERVAHNPYLQSDPDSPAYLVCEKVLRD
ncbi:hypothetical protein TNIN_67501 [Trichonephila inaurata madagascariensis]|uniref:Uncharacterized protein n=1 Tax=Trichonephila inaurata madagascariensis TaxID=2747483 RepID=A0A8X6IDY3_9ARAC|nr:hypothetical protein TNIN_67501 [Trichonephila inaurata madagascariensis]